MNALNHAVTFLSSPCIRKRHWEWIESTLHASLSPGMELKENSSLVKEDTIGELNGEQTSESATLQELLNSGLSSIAKSIEELADDAEQEYKLESFLISDRSFWENEKLIVTFEGDG